MSKLNELVNSLNDSNVEEIKEQILSETTARDKANRQLYSRAKKAEGYEYDKQNEKWIKKPITQKSDKPEKVESKNKKNEANEQALINSQKALLNSLGYKSQEEQKYILDESERLDKDISEIVGDKYHVSKLTDIKDQKTAQKGMPKGRGTTGDVERDVDYHLKNNTTPDNVELANKVIDARTKASKGPMFADELHSGNGEL